MKKTSLVIMILIATFMSGSVFADNLEQLSRTALDRNLKLKIAHLEIEQSFIDQKNALNAMIPDLNFNVTRSHKTFKDSYQKSNPFSFDTTLIYSLKLTQSYPGLGRIPSIKSEISKLKTKIKETSKQNQKILVLRQLSRVYFQLVREQELVKVHKTDLLLISELMKVAKLNEEVGLVLKNDILRIEVEQLNSQSNLIKNENGFHDLTLDLASILDFQSTDQINLELPTGLKFNPGSFTSQQLLPLLYENDNEIKLAELDAAILRKAEKAARSAHLPTLSFDGTYNHGRKMGPIEGTKDIAATFILTTPIYNGYEIENSVRIAKKSREIAKLRIADLKNLKKASLEKSIADYNEALARISFAEKATEQSIENMRIVFTRYQEGASSIVELIDAQRILTNSSQTAIKAYYDERERLVEILLLIHDFDSLVETDLNPFPLDFDFFKKQLELGIGDN